MGGDRHALIPRPVAGKVAVVPEDAARPHVVHYHAEQANRQFEELRSDLLPEV